MYCSRCGNSVSGGLNYCNTCGASIENNSSRRSRPTPWGLFTISGTFIVVIGLMVFFPVLRTILDNPIDNFAKVLLILSYLFTLLLMFAATMTMAWKQLSVSNAANPVPDDTSYKSPVSFKGINTSQLREGDAAFSSVTDETTRTLDEVTVPRR